MLLMWHTAVSLLIATQCFAQIATPPEVESVTSKFGSTYQFKYKVHDFETMDYKTHEEFGDNGSVRGTYTVREPNGNLRVVSYTAVEGGGFQAMVRVKPIAAGQLDSVRAELASDQTTTPAKNETGAPLRIQLDSGRRIYVTNQRQQRQSSSTKQSKILPTSLYQGQMLFQQSTHQQPQDKGHNIHPKDSPLEGTEARKSHNQPVLMKKNKVCSTES